MSVSGTSISVTFSQNGGNGSGSDDTSTTIPEEAFASAAVENPISSATTAAYATGSQALGFGLLVTVFSFPDTVVLRFVRISNGVRSERWYCLVDRFWN